MRTRFLFCIVVGLACSGQMCGPPVEQPSPSLYVSAGVEQTIEAGQGVVLSGWASGGVPPHTFQWTQRSGPIISLLDPTLPVTGGIIYDPGVVILRLTVTDSQGDQKFHQVRINVLPKALPAPPSGPSPCQDLAYYNSEYDFGMQPPQNASGPAPSDQEAVTGQLVNIMFLLNDLDARKLYLRVFNLDQDTVEDYLARHIPNTRESLGLVLQGYEEFVAVNHEAYLLTWEVPANRNRLYEVLSGGDGRLISILAAVFSSDPPEVTESTLTSLRSLCVR